MSILNFSLYINKVKSIKINKNILLTYMIELGLYKVVLKKRSKHL